ncbi:unnamed protein product [Trichobilharzia regenti]|uniref:Uncharacterized protein n=1 Tax=Trichobilharzia regenti TaxID=157069 RepID=A0A183VMA1_TRIRE|nr:unnamed protein product [Trichobilharzia regenti]VDP97486.1 unnamed protein product [Trichobilharzia regenti]
MVERISRLVYYTFIVINLLSLIDKHTHGYCIKKLYNKNESVIKTYDHIRIQLTEEFHWKGILKVPSWECYLVPSKRVDKRKEYVECCYTEQLPGDKWSNEARDQMILSGIYTSDVSGAEYYPFQEENWKYFHPDNLPPKP